MKIWQYIFAGVIGACLGFALQYVIDNGGESWVTVKTDYPSRLNGPLPESGKYYEWTYRLEGRSLGTPYRGVDGTLAYPGLPDNVTKEGYPPIAKQEQWKALWYQLRVLNWLQSKGDVALRTATIGGLVLCPYGYS